MVTPSVHLLLAFLLALWKRRRIQEEHKRNARRRRLFRFYRLCSVRKLHMCSMLALVMMRHVGRRRRTIWCRERSRHWWDTIVSRLFTDKDWLENFRMRKQTFEFICQALEGKLLKKDTNMRKCIPVKMRVALTLWKLATNCEYRTLGHLFGIARNTCNVIFHETISAINTELGPAFLTNPNERQLKEIIAGFETKFGFPQVVGAIDGTHIPVIAPESFPADYYNRKGFHSIILQAVVDHNYMFWNINCGYPGRCHDARVFSNSNVFELGSTVGFHPESLSRRINGVDIQPFIIGDAAYPLLNWVMKPYIDNGSLSPEQQQFNYKLSRARMVVENAFGRLKGRWRCLMKRNDARITEIPNITKACCVLHNICEVYREDFQFEWLENTDICANQPCREDIRVDEHINGANIRDTLARYMYF